jgi:chromosome segregation ATPase
MASWAETLEKIFGITATIDAMKDRVNRIEERLSRFEERLSNVESRLAGVEEMRATFQAQMQVEITKAITDLLLDYARRHPAPPEKPSLPESP